jgi:hypothetical protein
MLIEEEETIETYTDGVLISTENLKTIREIPDEIELASPDGKVWSIRIGNLGSVIVADKSADMV